MGEKKRRLAAQGVRPPHFDGRSIAQAFRALEAGDQNTAEHAFDALQAAAPREAEALHSVGVLGLRLGRTERAAELLASAIALDPERPDYRCHLAIAWRRLGKPDQAMAELEAALQRDPALAEAHSNLGILLLERSDHEAARRSFERALAQRRDFPDALNGLGMAELALGQPERACVSLERALALDPVFHEARYNLSRARSQWAASLQHPQDAENGQPESTALADLALDDILAALQLRRDNPAYWAQFEACAARVDLHHPVDARLRRTLLEALDHAAVEPARLARPIIGIFVTHPDAVAVAREPALGNVATRDATVDAAWRTFARHAGVLLSEELFVRLLEDTVVPNAFLQRFVALARQGMLAEFAKQPGAEPSLPLPAIAAIAHQSFNTEYANGESADESALVAQLRAAVATARAAGTAVPLHWYAIHACYRPLHTLDAPEETATELMPTALRSLALRQIKEPLEERRIRPTIAALTEVADPVSAAVQQQYEANPYPRWLRTVRPSAPMPLAAFLRREFPGADLAGVPEKPIRILVAGCGTGRHPIGTAQRFADASVLAVDLSRTSLAYAIRKTQESGLTNVEYAQADVLALGTLPERFDVIECAGVLHHLRDPLAGWRILCSLLRPGGVMRIALYSERARRHVVRARELVAAEGFTPTPEGIRAFRAAVLARADDPLLARLAQGEDFFSQSGCRDLAFHVEEHRFTLPAIAAMLAKLELRFLGFEGLDPGIVAACRARFPDDPALRDLASWDRFEAQRPDTFAGMYRFWVRGPT